MSQHMFGSERDGPLPSFIIIGAQKSASTLLHGLVAQHPSIYMPLGETPAFEDPEYDAGGIRRLRRLLSSASPDARLGIKRPDYLARPECASRIALHEPNALLIAVLRNPIDRAISAYYHYMLMGWLPICHIETGLRSLLRGEHCDRYPRGNEVLEFGDYARHLHRYFGLFPRSQLLVFLQEDLLDDREASLSTIFRFLDVDPTYTPDLTRAPDNAGLYSLPRLRYRAAVRPLAKNYSSDRTRFTPRKGWLKNALLALDSRILATVLPSRKPVLSRELHMLLARRYHSEILRLGDVIERDVRHWLAK